MADKLLTLSVCRYHKMKIRGLNKSLIFLEHFFYDILCVSAKMFLVFFVKRFRINWFSIFQNDMTGFHCWKMCFPHLSCIVHGNGDDGAFCLCGNFEASFMEREHIQLAFCLISCALRENADGNAGLYFLNCCENGFQPLL